jgi:hypothetical protein
MDDAVARRQSDIVRRTPMPPIKAGGQYVGVAYLLPPTSAFAAAASCDGVVIVVVAPLLADRKGTAIGKERMVIC